MSGKVKTGKVMREKREDKIKRESKRKIERREKMERETVTR